MGGRLPEGVCSRWGMTPGGPAPTRLCTGRERWAETRWFAGGKLETALSPWQRFLSFLSFFWKDLFLLFFHWKGGYTEQRQRGRSSVRWFTPQVSAMADAMPIQSQEPLPGLPRGCRVPKLWAVLDCFPGPQTGSWKGSRAAGIEPAPIWDPGRARRGLNHLRHRAGPHSRDFLRALF